jgi:HEPN domain-containing protein
MNEKTINNWLSQSDYDNQTALAMLKSGRYLYVAFMCQQSVEKLLKSIVIKKRAETPPYIHNLKRLIALIELNEIIPEHLNEFILELNTYYIEARYTEDIEELSKEIDKLKAELIYNQTQELIEWLTKNT